MATPGLVIDGERREIRYGNKLADGLSHGVIALMRVFDEHPDEELGSLRLITLLRAKNCERNDKTVGSLVSELRGALRRVRMDHALILVEGSVNRWSPSKLNQQAPASTKKRRAA